MRRRLSMSFPKSSYDGKMFMFLFAAVHLCFQRRVPLLNRT